MHITFNKSESGKYPMSRIITALARLGPELGDADVDSVFPWTYFGALLQRNQVLPDRRWAAGPVVRDVE